MPTDKNISDSQFALAAKRLHEKEGEIEVDFTADVSRGDDSDDGAYVQAWVWVPNEEARQESEGK